MPTGLGFWCFLAAVRPAATVALLLLVGGGRRSFLPPRHGRYSAEGATDLRGGVGLPRPSHCKSEENAQVYRVRPRQPIQFRGLPRLVPCKGIKPPRYGAIGKHGSIAVVERFILTMKCLLAGLLPVPYRRESFRRELDAIAEWYNSSRPHTWLGGRTPDEAYGGKTPANRRPRFEPRARWPRGSPSARPQTLIKGQPGVRLELKVSFHKGRKHLPLVALTRAA